jgi:arginyl-tRNA--protein-N-Asp/Glu arginylyltransferase
VDLQVIELFTITPEQLDSLLALGWFRIQQTIFTTDILTLDDEVYNTIWLRIRLKDFQADNKYASLHKKNNRFTTEIKKAIITEHHETLYSVYKESVSFEAASSLHWLLYGNSINDAFNTYVINVYDNEKLIAAGFFDLGKTSSAGICSFYDPAYKKYSLGKYIIYEKIIYCKKEDFDFFYPGYFVPGYSRFDYKLDIGKSAIEYFDSHKKEWLFLPAILTEWKRIENNKDLNW